MAHLWPADDVPAAAYTPHTNFTSILTLLCTRLLQTPNPTSTLASAPASLTVPSSWPTSGQTDPRRLQTDLTKLQTPGHPVGGAKLPLKQSKADTVAAATDPRHINFERSIPVSTLIASALPQSARAEGKLSCTAKPCADAVSAQQQQSASTSKRKRASKKGETAQEQQEQQEQHAHHAQHAQQTQHTQQAEGSIGVQMPGETSDRAVKRSKLALNDQHLEVPAVPLAPRTRELRAMTSVRGSRHAVRPRLERECAAWGEAAEAGNSRSDQQAVIVMETTIQQLQFELKVGNDTELYTACCYMCPASFLQAVVLQT